MESKSILIISASFYPEISPRAFRTTELAKELSRQGHNVTIYIPFYANDYTSFASEHQLTIKNIGGLKWKDRVLKGGKIQFILRRAMRRVLKMLFEWPDIEFAFRVNKVLQRERNYDILISIAVPYPIHWGVALAKGKTSDIAKCWIADCGDPYMGDIMDSFRKLFYFKYIEKWFCKKADFITVPFPGAISAYYPEFHDKIRIIPQGFNLNELNLPPYQKLLPYPTFAYAGGFIPGKRDPQLLLEFLAGLKEKFKFIIYTSQVEVLYNAKKILGEKLEIRSLIPRADLLSELSRMDFLINFDNNVKTQLPSKLIDYSITGRPVLNIKKDDDFSVLLRFFENDYSRKMDLEPLETYNIKSIAKQFVDLYKSV